MSDSMAKSGARRVCLELAGCLVACSTDKVNLFAPELESDEEKSGTTAYKPSSYVPAEQASLVTGAAAAASPPNSGETGPATSASEIVGDDSRDDLKASSSVFL